ncbi:MAG: L,D-transpeptidase, partial [Lachnospiraceae bacterium]
MLCFFISIPVLRVQASEQNQTNEMIEEADEPACNYVILVNKTQNIVQVKNQKEDGTEEPVKTFVCSCGRKGHGTPAGTFKTTDYYEWRSLKDGSYGRYVVRFNNHILFHSVPYVSMTPDSLEWEQYNLLGETASLGCVRLAVADAKWIYDNCGPGTKV